MKNYEIRIRNHEERIIKPDSSRCALVVYTDHDIWIDKKLIPIAEGKSVMDTVRQYHLETGIPNPPRRFVIPAFKELGKWTKTNTD